MPTSKLGWKWRVSTTRAVLMLVVLWFGMVTAVSATAGTTYLVAHGVWCAVTGCTDEEMK